HLSVSACRGALPAVHPFPTDALPISFDARDPASRPQARPTLLEVLRQAPPVPPRLAFVRSPVWDQAEEDVKAGFAELVEALGEQIGRASCRERGEMAGGGAREE